jgi:hypothetical protein
MHINQRLAVLFFCLTAGSASAQVTVHIAPAQQTHSVGDLFSVTIKADIAAPVVGWGLDLSFNTALITRVSPPTIGPIWVAAPSSDGDGLAGFAFPSGISGNDILLATLQFSATSIGQSDLVLSVTPGDLNEGFPLELTGFSNITFVNGHVSLVPEPSACLVFIGFAALVWPQRSPSFLRRTN